MKTAATNINSLAFSPPPPPYFFKNIFNLLDSKTKAEITNSITAKLMCNKSIPPRPLH